MSLLNQPLHLASDLPTLLDRDIIFLKQTHPLVAECSCPICHDALSKTERPVQVRNNANCTHVFGYKCLTEWLRQNNTCPMCRTALYIKSEPSRGPWAPSTQDLMTAAEIDRLFGPTLQGRVREATIAVATTARQRWRRESSLLRLQSTYGTLDAGIDTFVHTSEWLMRAEFSDMYRRHTYRRHTYRMVQGRLTEFDEMTRETARHEERRLREETLRPREEQEGLERDTMSPSRSFGGRVKNLLSKVKDAYTS